MCNHYRDADEIIAYVQMLMPWVKVPEIPREWAKNVFPKRNAQVIVKENDEFVLTTMRWGIWPFYEQKMPSQLRTNARRDGLTTKGLWKKSVQARRCLIPATGYFEPGLGPEGAKGEVLFTVKETPVFIIAGFWDRDPGDAGGRGFTFVTTEPNEYVGRYHDRMPVVLKPNRWQQWVGDSPIDQSQIDALCDGLPEDAYTHEEIAAKPKEKLTIKRPAKKAAEPPEQGMLF